jgi:hypothetical protein
MDNIRQVGKRFKKTDSNAQQNVRRAKENFPQIERVADRMNANQPYKHYFNLSRHDHTVALNLYFNEPEKDCHPEPLDVIAIAVGDCPSFPGSDGGTGFAVYPIGEHAGGGDFFTQIGAFVNMYPESGIKVPVSGYYEIIFVNGPSGVSTGGNSGCVAAIAVNGSIIIDQLYSNENPDGLALFSPRIRLTTVTYLAAGDIVAGVLSATGIAFWTPSNICGIFGGSPTTITLVGAA